MPQRRRPTPLSMWFVLAPMMWLLQPLCQKTGLSSAPCPKHNAKIVPSRHTCTWATNGYGHPPCPMHQEKVSGGKPTGLQTYRPANLQPYASTVLRSPVAYSLRCFPFSSLPFLTHWSLFPSPPSRDPYSLLPVVCPLGSLPTFCFYSPYASWLFPKLVSEKRQLQTCRSSNP